MNLCSRVIYIFICICNSIRCLKSIPTQELETHIYSCFVIWHLTFSIAMCHELYGKLIVTKPVHTCEEIQWSVWSLQCPLSWMETTAQAFSFWEETCAQGSGKYSCWWFVLERMMIRCLALIVSEVILIIKMYLSKFYNQYLVSSIAFEPSISCLGWSTKVCRKSLQDRMD